MGCFLGFFLVQDAALESNMDFWISLCCQFEANQQLSSLINILNFVLQLPVDKHEGETQGIIKSAPVHVALE